MKTKYFILPIVSIMIVLFIGLMFTIPKNTFSQNSSKNNKQSESITSPGKFSGLCYGPHHDNEDPDRGVQPTIEELSQDIAFISKLTNSIRTYGVTDNLEQIPILCQKYEIDCYPCAWISIYECENETQIDNLIQIVKMNLSHVKGLIVGNEVLLRNSITEEKLIEYISRVKQSTSLPVASAEIWKYWIDHPQLAQAVDIIFVHIYPYWDGVAIENSAAYILEKWNEVKSKYPDKRIVIGETGWPSQGEIRDKAIPSEENQRRFVSDFLAIAESNNIEYFYFEIFDEKWKSKSEGEIGSHWGLFYSNGTPKSLLNEFIPEQALNGIERSARIVYPKEATFPLHVYLDGCNPKNSFYASGWMGDLATYGISDSTYKNTKEVLNESYSGNPFSGETCIRISYSPSFYGWGGIYWQFPVNNWGMYPGYDLSKSICRDDSVKLKFHVRGEKGGEKAEFKTGGIHDSSLYYYDNYGPQTTGVITLKKEWEERSFDLTGKDLSMVIGGFCWVTNNDQNPDGCTIYLDEIVFEITSSKCVVDDESTTLVEFSLSQNIPNPFNPSTIISFTLLKPGKVTLIVYDLTGRKVTTLVNGLMNAGVHSVTFEGSKYASGVYFYRFESAGLTRTGKMLLLR